MSAVGAHEKHFNIPDYSGSGWPDGQLATSRYGQTIPARRTLIAGWENSLLHSPLSFFNLLRSSTRSHWAIFIFPRKRGSGGAAEDGIKGKGVDCSVQWH